MNSSLKDLERSLLGTLARTRGLTVKDAVRFPKLKALAGGSEPAVIKAFARLSTKCRVARSLLADGTPLYRLSGKGVRDTGAPPSFANFSPGIAAESVALSHLAWQSDRFVVLTKDDVRVLFKSLFPTSEPPSFMDRFLLRPIGKDSHLHLHVLLAEIRPADKLAERAQTVFHRLRQSELISELVTLGLFGVTICVPSVGVKATLEARTFPFEVSTVVIKELHHLVGSA